MDNFTNLTKQKLPVLNGKTLKNLGFKFAFLLLTFTMMLNVKAQLNIAPAATASASTCNTGACSTLTTTFLGLVEHKLCGLLHLQPILGQLFSYSLLG